jgi:hypothetical protein
MPDYSSLLARTFGFLGAVAVAVSTLLPWYDYEVVVATHPIVNLFEVPVDLWSLYPWAAAALTVGALVAMAMLAIPPAIAPRAPSAIAAVIGVGIAAYGIYRAFKVPDLGIHAVPRAGVDAATVIDAGALLAFVGGLVIVVGSLVVVVSASREAAAAGAGARTRRPRHGGAAPPSAA